MGMRATWSHASRTSAGRPSRSAPTTIVTGSLDVCGSARPMDVQRTPAAPASRASLVPGRAPNSPVRNGHVEDRAHAGAHRLGSERIGGARTEGHTRGAERLRGAQHRADVAGVADTMEVDANGAGRRRGPTLLVDGQRPRSRPELRSRGEELGEHRVTFESAAGRDESRDRCPAGGVGGRQQVLALGHEPAQPGALAAAPVQLADFLELLVVGACNRQVRDRQIWWNEKKAPSLSGGRPGVWCWCSAVAQPAASASRARSAKRRKVSASWTAMSARILRSSSTPARWRPWMNCE